VSRIFAALALAGAACGSSPRPDGAITLRDDAGHTTSLAGPAHRVVSLVPAATELLFALGAGSTVVGRTRWCDYPAAAAEVASVGDGIAPNVEAVVARSPDLVVAYRSPTNAMAIGRFRDLGIAVVELAFDRQEDFDRAAALLGRALGRPAAGDSLVRAVQADLEAATIRVDRPPRVFVLAQSDPPIAIGGGSFLSELLRRAGAVNVFGDVDRPSFPVSIEAVVDRDPDLLLVVGEAEPTFSSRPEWEPVAAVRARRFVRVSGSEFNRPSPRIGAAVRALARALREVTPR
jgi:iron complex transport system substrate-binding protein